MIGRSKDGKVGRPMGIDWAAILPELLNSEDRRASRLTWWKYLLSLLAVNALAFALASIPMNALGEEDPIFMGVAALWFVFVLWTVVVFVVVSIRRWHDMNRRGEWCFIVFVPVIGLVWFLVAMGFIPGTRGDNRYGSE